MSLADADIEDADSSAESYAEPTAALVEPSAALVEATAALVDATADAGILKSRDAEILLVNSPGDERGGAFSKRFVTAFIDMSVYI